MQITLGRGKFRRVYELPCAWILNRADKKERKMLFENICFMAGIPLGVESLP